MGSIGPEPTGAADTLQLSRLSPSPRPPRHRVDLIFGAIMFGQFYEVAGRELPFAKVEQIKPVLDAFQAQGYSRIDTARIYGAGHSEKLLGDINWQHRGLQIGTKLHPTKSFPLGPQNVAYSHDATDLHAGLKASLAALCAESVDTFYLYAPDRTVPYEITLQAIDALYNQGRFARWGLCKFPAWEVAMINEICMRHGWVRPAVYQGVYNLLIRKLETELVPCLRYYGMSLEAAQPLASGILTDRYRRDMPDTEHPPGSRFDPGHYLGRHIRERYWHDGFFDVLETLREAAKPYGLSELEVAMRWVLHHSVVTKELGDALVIGATTVAQLEAQMAAAEMGPLPQDVVDAIEAASEKSRHQAWQYHH